MICQDRLTATNLLLPANGIQQLADIAGFSSIVILISTG